MKTNGSCVSHVAIPGNGTRYEAIGVRLPSDWDAYGGQWLVSFPHYGVSHVFQKGSFVSVGYVDEKMGFDRHGNKISDVDLIEMTKLVSKIIGGKHNAQSPDQRNRVGLHLV